MEHKGNRDDPIPEDHSTHLLGRIRPAHDPTNVCTREGARRPLLFFVRIWVLHGSNVRRLQALGALVDFEFDHLVLGK